MSVIESSSQTSSDSSHYQLEEEPKRESRVPGSKLWTLFSVFTVKFSIYKMNFSNAL